MRILMTVIGLGASLATVGAAAADPSMNSTNATSSAAGSVKEPTYCIRSEPIAGSRIPTVTCKTKADWAKEGVMIEGAVKKSR